MVNYVQKQKQITHVNNMKKKLTQVQRIARLENDIMVLRKTLATIINTQEAMVQIMFKDEEE